MTVSNVQKHWKSWRISVIFVNVYVYKDLFRKLIELISQLDDDCDRHGISFVKTKDFSVAEQFGVHDFPALVYFENSIPNVFEGELNELRFVVVF